jgi:hypothetical protein
VECAGATRDAITVGGDAGPAPGAVTGRAPQATAAIVSSI